MVVLTDKQEIAEFAKANRLHLALGFFDGVHIGHQAILERVLTLARDEGGAPGALLLDPHPQQMLRADGYAILNPLEEKIRWIQALGDIHVFIQTFDKGFAGLSGETFAQDFLVGLYRVQTAVCGFNYHFGNRGGWGTEDLQQFAESYGFAHNVIPQVSQGGETVSSSAIRQCMQTGDMYGAYTRLGHCHIFSGKVCRGRHIGESIGFPTANLDIGQDLVWPAYGVYGGFILDEHGHVHRGVINVGVRPTVHGGDGSPSFEAHILGYTGDLYGHALQVALTDRRRPEARFDGLPALQAQIRKDIADADLALEAWASHLAETDLGPDALFSCFIKDYPV